jgi:hypothetical protein
MLELARFLGHIEIANGSSWKLRGHLGFGVKGVLLMFPLEVIG